MSGRYYVITYPTAGFRLLTIEPQGVSDIEIQFDMEAGTTAADMAEDIAITLRENGYRGEPILLALPSEMCLAAPISLDGLSPRDRAAMAFRLEEQLPIAAEDFVCDFIVDGASALGVATLIEPLKAFTDALAAEGMAIQSISPWMLLAASDGTGDRIELIDEEDSRINKPAMCNVIHIRDDRPTSWTVTPNIELALKVLALHGGELPKQQTRMTSPETCQHVAAEARKILSGKKHPWIELRRDALAPADRLSAVRGAVNTLVAAVAVFFLVLTAAAMIRATRYTHSAEVSDAALVADFHSLYPDWNTANIPAVIESEHRKLLTSAANTLPAEAKGSALRTLHDVLATVPANKSFSVDRMTFDADAFELEGKAGSLADVDDLTNATRRAGLTVQPPQSRREETGQWSFTIRGSKLPATASAQQEGR